MNPSPKFHLGSLRAHIKEWPPFCMFCVHKKKRELEAPISHINTDPLISDIARVTASLFWTQCLSFYLCFPPTPFCGLWDWQQNSKLFNLLPNYGFLQGLIIYVWLRWTETGSEMEIPIRCANLVHFMGCICMLRVFKCVRKFGELLCKKTKEKKTWKADLYFITFCLFPTILSQHDASFTSTSVPSHLDGVNISCLFCHKMFKLRN